MFARLFGRGRPPDRKEPSLAAPVSLPILARRSVFADSDDKKIVSALIDEYVNPLIEHGNYFQDELPRNAIRSYSADYYMAQVANGGHAQFLRNSAGRAYLLPIVREGLSHIGVEPFISIFAELESFVATAAQGANDPILAGLDKRFHAARCYETLMPANGRWLKSLPDLKVVPDAQFGAQLKFLADANPYARARNIVRQRIRITALLQDTLHVAARLLGFECGLLPIQIGGGDPSARLPDGRTAMGWTVSAPEAPLTMFLIGDAAILCEQYLPDGRKITSALTREVQAALMAKPPNLDAMVGFDKKVSKEIARVAAALVEEAKAVGRDGRVLAAAEVACAKLDTELPDLHALSKAKLGRSEQVWCFALWTKRGNYTMWLGRDKVLVAPVINGEIQHDDHFVVTDAEVRRHQASMGMSQPEAPADKTARRS